MVRLEPVGPRRPHVMQHQDRADAADQRPQRPVCAAEVERVQRRAKNLVLKAFHRLPRHAADCAAASSSAGGGPDRTATWLKPADCSWPATAVQGVRRRIAADQHRIGRGRRNGRERDLGLRASIEHEIVVALRQRADRGP